MKKKTIALRYIVVHSTRSTDTEIPPLGAYHFLIHKSGRLQTVRKVKDDSPIRIALVGGVDKAGQPCDNRTDRQTDTLFNALILLSDRHPRAAIVGADALDAADPTAPSFDVKDWLKTYIPAFLEAA